MSSRDEDQVDEFGRTMGSSGSGRDRQLVVNSEIPRSRVSNASNSERDMQQRRPPGFAHDQDRHRQSYQQGDRYQRDDRRRGDWGDQYRVRGGGGGGGSFNQPPHHEYSHQQPPYHDNSYQPHLPPPQPYGNRRYPQHYEGSRNDDYDRPGRGYDREVGGGGGYGGEDGRGPMPDRRQSDGGGGGYRRAAANGGSGSGGTSAGGAVVAAASEGAGARALGSARPLYSTTPIRIKPLMSFKTFMQSQQEDLPPDAFQKRYDQFQLTYLKDLAEKFFQASMREEWFQDRYNPLNLHNSEKAATERASSENATFKLSLFEYPEETVKAMCLDAPPRQREQGVSRFSTAATSSNGATGEAVGAAKEEAEEVVVGRKRNRDDDDDDDEGVRDDSDDAEGNGNDGAADAGAGGGGGGGNEKEAKQQEDAEQEKATAAGEDDAKVVTVSTTTGTGATSGAMVPTPPLTASYHLDGHSDRTVFLSMINACCPKQVLVDAIKTALQTASSKRGGSDADAAGASEGSGSGSSEREKAVAAVDCALTPSRIVIGPPLWGPTTHHASKFERSAWLVMPTVQSARLAVNVLRNLEVKVPAREDPSSTSEEVPVAFSFTVHARIHTPRVHIRGGSNNNNSNNNNNHRDFSSHFAKVEVDTARALELAELLDEECGIEPESRLARLLAAPAVADALVKPTDTLDVATAYLRRVHLVAFSVGKRFRDEGSLLNACSSVTYRSRPYIPPPPHPSASPSSATGNSAADNPAEEVTAVGGKRKRDREGEEDEEEKEENKVKEGEAEEEAQKGEDENQAAAAVGVVAVPDEEEEDTSGKQVGADDNEQNLRQDATTAHNAIAAAAAAVGQRDPRAPHVPLADRRIETMIAELKARKQSRTSITATAAGEEEAEVAESVGPISSAVSESAPPHATNAEAEDAKEILELHDKNFEQSVAVRCKSERESKWRCCFASCKKLFKGVEFLAKHLRSKHPSFAAEVLVADAEPYMRKRFESEDLERRPLPPIELEQGGRIQYSSVHDIMQKATAGAGAGIGGRFGGGGGGGRGGGRVFDRDRRASHDGSAGGGNGEFRRRGQDDRDRRNSFGGGGGGDRARAGGGGGGGGGDRRDSSGGGGGGVRRRTSGPPPPQQHEYQEPKPEDNNSRSMTNYLDVDAPKESAVSLDYGVALPPVKKRKTRKSM